MYSRLCGQQREKALSVVLSEKHRMIYMPTLPNCIACYFEYLLRGYTHHVLSALSSGERLLRGPGENQGSQLLHRIDFTGYYLCLHSSSWRFKVLNPITDSE